MVARPTSFLNINLEYKCSLLKHILYSLFSINSHALLVSWLVFFAAVPSRHDARVVFRIDGCVYLGV